MRILFLLLCLTSTSIFAQVAPRDYAAQRTTGPITIDGKLDEPDWLNAEFQGDFVEAEPNEGATPLQKTEFAIRYDDKNLYVAIRAYDDDMSAIERRSGRRDSFEGDYVEINFDSNNDKRTGFSFSATAAGVKGEEFISQNGENWDETYNPIWYLAVADEEDAYVTEFRIPLSQLRFGSAEIQDWGMQVTRRYFRDDSIYRWQRILADAGGFVSEFGTLSGLEGLKSQKQLEIQPFVVAQLDDYEEETGNPFRTGSDFNLNAGLDAKIGITNDLTLDLTVNPDFGQVEADPAAIALDGFQIFFREQRPFFVQGNDIFSYRVADGQSNLFYSRRIGRSPQGSAFGPLTAFVDQPDNTTILGAAKFSGKTSDGWSIGALQSITARETAEVLNSDGTEREVIVEPLTSYSVARLQKDFNERRTYIGGIFTSVVRDMEPNLNSLHSHAYSGGLDFQHTWKDFEYFVKGTFSLSHVRGSAEAIQQTQTSINHLFQRPDADHVSVDPTRTSLTGTGGRLFAGKQGGKHWRYEGGVIWKSPELEINDIGFIRETDDIRTVQNIAYLWNEPSSWYRRASASLNVFQAFDFGGNYQRIQYEGRFETRLQNYMYAGIGGAHKPRIYSNSFLRGGPRWSFGSENYYFAFVGTDQRKKWTIQATYVNSQGGEDLFAYREYSLDFNYQPFNALSISLSPQFTDAPNRGQYVTTTDNAGQPRYVLARIDNQTLQAALRVNYNMGPNLSVQYYGQPFVSRGAYDRFKYVINGTADRFADRAALLGDDQISLSNGIYEVDEDGDGGVDYAFGNPDFSFVQFRSNLVLRWEYIPGSELFLVWSQGTEGLAGIDRSLTQALDSKILGERLENTFLIKATYRFVL